MSANASLMLSTALPLPPYTHQYMIEYDCLNDIYTIHFSDDTDVKGWVRELNGLVFVGLNDHYTHEWIQILDELLENKNNMIRKEIPVIALRDKPKKAKRKR